VRVEGLHGGVGLVLEQARDRDVHAIRRRAVHVVEILIDALHAQRSLERQGVAGTAAIAVRRNDDDFGNRLQVLGERAQAARLIAVVVGEQNSHWPFPWLAARISRLSRHQRSAAGGAGAI
jgi:hypothetical protein